MELKKEIIPESPTDYNAINALQALSHCDVRGGRVLVVGCNRGKDCSYFIIAGAREVHGVDVIDETGVEFKHEKVTYHKKSAEKMDFLPDDYFDLVYCFATMEHIPDIAAAFSEMARVCKKGGTVYSVASPLWHSAYGNHRDNFFKDYPWIHLCLSSGEIKEWFRKNMAEKMPEVFMDIDKHIKGLFESGTELFNKRKSSEYLDVCDNLGLEIIVNEAEKDPSHVLTDEAKNKLVPIYGEDELLGMTHRFVGRKSLKFSIIIPVYNAVDSLAETLDSILVQTCKNYEVIIVDGLSTDSTQKIIEEYEKKPDGRLRWISELDKGIYDAMNKGIDMARGDWIYFLGSDDVLYSNDVLEKISNEIGESNPDVISGNVAWGNTGKIYDGKFSALKLMQENICHQSIFFKKSLFDKFGKYDTKYKVLADHVFNMQWFNDESVRRKYVDLTIARYNVDGQSSVSCAPDEEFTKDRDKIIRKYFPKEYVDLIEKPEQNEKIQQLERELEVMKSSKFWKIRNFYMRIKSFFSSKNHS